MSLDQVDIQSKILKSVLKAFGIAPTIPGLIEGMGGDPAKVFELVRFVQANGERLTHSFEAAVIGTAERVQRIEEAQKRQSAMLERLCALHNLNVHAPAIGRVTQAVLDEASGRS
jgi:hypothetical protein